MRSWRFGTIAIFSPHFLKQLVPLFARKRYGNQRQLTKLRRFATFCYRPTSLKDKNFYGERSNSFITMGRYPPEEDPEESPPLEAESAEEKGKRKQRNVLIVVIMFVVVLAAILIGVFVSEDKNKEKVSESNQAGDPKSPSGEPQTYVSVNGPFEVEIPIYCPKNIGVYVDEGEAGVGFRQLALFLMNNVVNRNLEVPGFQNVGFGSNGGRFRPTEEVDMVMPPVADNGAASSIGQVGDELDSFQTNNQEENVDQADNSKSDGEYIYSAYGDYLLVTRASTGELVLKEQMPQIECSNDQYSGPEEVIGGVQVPEDNINDTSEKESRSYVMPPYLYCPRPYIQALLLDGSTLAVVVSGYGSQYRAQLTDSPVLNDFLSTHVRLYGTDELNKKGHELVPRGTQDIHGYYRRGFLIDGIAHIATMSSLNTWDWIVYPNERFNPAYQNLSKEEYLEAVKKNGDTIASRFVSQLIAELSMTAGAFPNVANLNLLTDDTSGVDGFESIIFGEGYANSMVQLTSFEMSQTSEDNELAAEITCQFLPTSWGEIYSADDMLIVAGQGYHFDPSLGASEDMTYLFGFSLDGVYTDPAISGKVPGYLLNPYSVDYVGGRLRVATTIQNRWFIDVVLRPAATSVEAAEEPPSVPTDESATSSAVSAISSGGSSGSSTGGLVKASGDFVFLSECTQEADDECFDENTERRCSELTEKGCDGMFYWSLDCPYELKCLDWFENSICPLPGEPCVDGKNFAACIDLEKQGCEILMVLESCPMRFECEPPPIVIPPWTPPPRITKNQIFVLDASDGAELEIVGNVTMGKPGEGEPFDVHTVSAFYMSFSNILFLLLLNQSLLPSVSLIQLRMLSLLSKPILFMSSALRRTQRNPSF